MNSQNNLLTIIISCHERQDYFDRILKYYQSFSCKKLILDSSQRPLYSNQKLNNFDYYHCPGNELEKKLKLSCDLIDTKYVLYADHDDLYSKYGITACVDYLEENPHIAWATGQIIHINSDKKYVLYQASNYLKNVNKIYSNDPIERLMQSRNFQRGINRINAVHRTENFIEFYRNFNEKMFFTVFFAHAVNQFFTLCGPHHVLPVLYAIRDSGGNQVRDKSVYDYSNITQAFNSSDEKAVKNRAKAIKIICEKLKKQNLQLTDEQCLNIVINAYKISINSFLLHRQEKLERAKINIDLKTQIKQAQQHLNPEAIDQYLHLFRDFKDNTGAYFQNEVQQMPLIKSITELQYIKTFLN